MKKDVLQLIKEAAISKYLIFDISFTQLTSVVDSGKNAVKVLP